MKIGILVPFVNNFGKLGFYNSQEIGLAKGLALNGFEVIVYKCTINKNECTKKRISDNVSLVICLAKHIGNNGLIFTNFLDSTINYLICFSDTQLCVKKIFKWCVYNHIEFIPYIGTLHSNSPSFIIRFMKKFLIKKNLNIYRKSKCFFKTALVKDEAEKLQILNGEIMSVGLDFDLLEKNFYSYNKNQIKSELGFSVDDKIILFIGRLVKEKRPLDLIDIFKEIHDEDKKFKLVVIGEGPLRYPLMNKINEYRLSKSCLVIGSVGNSGMWKYYYSSDFLFNLNKHEIFGMTILEGLYYKCNVIATAAPGPNFVIQNNENGRIVEDDRDFCKIVFEGEDLGDKGHETIVKYFMWDKTIHNLIIYIKGV